ncbi:MAG TPA: hypothetical protein VEK76_08805 [Candidatus Binatia bacterium]|nr:hypothetical protein [Candidatus Binatia bacterium]
MLGTATRRRGGAETSLEAVLGSPDDPPPRPASRSVVDAAARTYWSRGADSPVTLVESDSPAPRPQPLRERLRDLMSAHERGRPPSSRPTGNPAFSETLFVELIRRGQYPRAFALLAPECQHGWGSAERFAEAHRGGGLSRLDGVSVLAVRHLDEWVDPHRGHRHHGVAELDVEYGFDAGTRPVVLRRTVHLVAVDGRWRSLSYPAEAAATPA